MKNGELNEDIWWDGEFEKLLSKFYRATLSALRGPDSSRESALMGSVSVVTSASRTFDEQFDEWVRALNFEMEMREKYPHVYRRMG